MISQNNFDLGGLASPSSLQDPLIIADYSDRFDRFDLIHILKQMLLIRKAEFQIATGRRDGLIGGPVHLGVGQEGVASGVSLSLTSNDMVFGAHRSHSHILSLGSDLRKLFSEVLGRATGHSKGFGGSMHLLDETVGFMGSVPIVAGTVSLAVGAAMSARLKKNNSVSVAYLGDGACEEGVVHESLNLASLNKEPILFVVENNLFSSHMHISKRQPYSSTSRFASANSIPFRVVDGNNVLSVATSASELIALCRSGQGPGFLEAVTYRWYGHVDWRSDVDVGVQRSNDDIHNWKKRDPIRRLKLGMINESMLTESEFVDIDNSVSDFVKACWNDALSDPFPKAEDLQAIVFSASDSSLY